MSNPYRDYYLASQENLRLGETVGVSSEQWASLDERYAAAIAACEAAEEGTITITISREDAEGWLSNDDYPHGVAWEAVDDAIRAALEGER